MKPYCSSAIAILLFAFCSLTLSQSGHTPKKCCFKANYMKSRIPARAVSHFEITSPECRAPGVIFHTVNLKQICADPTLQWALELMRAVEQREKDSSFSSTETKKSPKLSP